jgi:uncharacterized protein YecE (DUF72 family)
MYKSWAKSFYPDHCPARRQFEFYSSKFPTVEINATFYRLPQEKTFESWQEQSCPGFLYAVKGSQAVTHFKRLPISSICAFHCLSGGSEHDYTDRELEPWAEHLRRSVRRGLIGFVYFNNDVNTRAPLNALRLMDMVGKYAVRPRQC